MLRLLILSACLAASGVAISAQAQAAPATDSASPDASPAVDEAPPSAASVLNGANAADDPLGTVRAAFNQAKALSTSQAFQAGVQKQRAGLTTVAGQPAVHPQFQVNGLQPSTQATVADELSTPTRQWAAESRQPLLILASFSMPDSELRELATQGARIGAPLVLRGLVDDSFPATQKRLLPFRQIHGAYFRIDPTVFQRFGVDQVPTFILPLEALQTCSTKSCPAPAHVQVIGDAGLDYVLAEIDRRSNDPRAHALAQQLRAQLTAE